MGSVHGKAKPSLFRQQARDFLVVIHGDGTIGDSCRVEELSWQECEMSF